MNKADVYCEGIASLPSVARNDARGRHCEEAPQALTKQSNGVNRRRYQRKSASTGFTYIEILITLAVMAVLFIPMMRLFTHGLFSASISGELISAVNLGRWEMERLKNLNLTKEQLKKEGDAWIPPLEEEPLEMNNAKWRIQRRINPESDPVEVSVRVFLADDLNKPVATLDTLFEDNLWIEERVK